MKHYKVFIVILFLGLSVFSGEKANAYPGRSDSSVTDLCGALTSGTKTQLESVCQQFTASKSGKMALLIIPDYYHYASGGEEDITDFLDNLFMFWNMRPKDILIVYQQNYGKYHIRFGERYSAGQREAVYSLIETKNDSGEALSGVVVLFDRMTKELNPRIQWSSEIKKRMGRVVSLLKGYRIEESVFIRLLVMLVGAGIGLALLFLLLYWLSKKTSTIDGVTDLKNAHRFNKKSFFDPGHLVYLFFSFHGRINRQRYFFGMVLLWGLLFVIAILADYLKESVAVVFLLVILLLMLWSHLMLIIKRGHDLNMSAFICLLIMAVPFLSVVVFLLSVGVSIHFFMESATSLAFGPGLLVSVGLLMICPIVETIFHLFLLFLKGKSEINRFGKDPLLIEE